MNVLSTLKSAQLSSGDGQLNLQPILEAQKNIATANQSLQQQVQKYQQLPKAHIGMVKNAYATGNTQLMYRSIKKQSISSIELTDSGYRSIHAVREDGIASADGRGTNVPK